MRLALAAALLFLASSPVLAADAAERDILGFSRDGTQFAFEQFGVQDGSGFPYSEVFVIDIDKDAWLPGTPVRAFLEDETRSLADARGEAKRKAEPILATMGIVDAGTLLASASAYQAVAEPRQMTFRTFYQSGGNTEPIEDGDEGVATIVLEEIVLPSPRGCPVSDTPLVGFVLRMRSSGSDLRDVHRDAEIPTSRGCPLRYALSDVVAYSAPSGNRLRLVALVSVYSYGFEGMDRRFLAVPIQ